MRSSPILLLLAACGGSGLTALPNDNTVPADADADTDTDVTEGEPQPGDVSVYRVGRCFSHGAIVTEWPFIIHAFRDERAVVITRFDVGRLASKTYKVMRIGPTASATQGDTP